MNKHLLLNVFSGFALLIILSFGSMLGILADKNVVSQRYRMEAGVVAIEFSANDGYAQEIMIEPNQFTTLNARVVNVGSRECYVFIELVIPEINGHPIFSITPTGNWQKIDDERNVYQYVVDGFGKALNPGDETQELVYQARFYDFTELVDFSGEVKVIAYAVQTNGFNEASAFDIWRAAVEATGGDSY